MKLISNLYISELSTKYFNKILSKIKNKPEFTVYPDGKSGNLNISLEHDNNDIMFIENFCKKKRIEYRLIKKWNYSQEEIDTIPFFQLNSECISGLKSVDKYGTQYSNKETCSLCGIGSIIASPIIMPKGKLKKDISLISLQHSKIWIISSEVAKLIDGFSGFYLKHVVDSRSKEIIPDYHQLIIDSSLPRMSPLTNFSDWAGNKKCICNRWGWTLYEDIYYEQQTLVDAKDFNLTLERWSGFKPGIKGTIVSNRVRDILLKAKILKDGSFSPVHVIDQSPVDAQYKFDMPYDCGDTPSSQQ